MAPETPATREVIRDCIGLDSVMRTWADPRHRRGVHAAELDRNVESAACPDQG